MRVEGAVRVALPLSEPLTCVEARAGRLSAWKAERSGEAAQAGGVRLQTGDR